MSQQDHRSSPQVLSRRTLERDHRRLSRYLFPGAAVLDAGCGTGAITAGIGRAVGPNGLVVGVDRDPVLLDQARAEHAALSNLTFEAADATDLPFQQRFDVVTAARTLQWVADPARVLSCFATAAKPGGAVVVLDYNHDQNYWSPAPPPAYEHFYQAFLAWRAANHWDNAMADRLASLLEGAGLRNIEVFLDDEVTHRGDAEFDAIAGIWGHVIDGVGPRMVAAGFLTETDRVLAADEYRAFVQDGLQTQTLVMRTVGAFAPSHP